MSRNLSHKELMKEHSICAKSPILPVFNLVNVAEALRLGGKYKDGETKFKSHLVDHIENFLF